MNSSRKILLTVVLLLLTFLVSGCCGEITKIQECSTLIETVNANQPRFSEPGSEDPNKMGEALEAFAKTVRTSKKKLSKLELTDAELKKHASEYATMLEDVADASDALAKVFEDIKTATDAKDLKTLEAAQKRIDAVQKTFQTNTDKEGPIVDAINAYCYRE